jgi:hypothetical protein
MLKRWVARLSRLRSATCLAVAVSSSAAQADEADLLQDRSCNWSLRHLGRRPLVPAVAAVAAEEEEEVAVTADEARRLSPWSSTASSAPSLV